jgi:hypothetical protein
VWVSEPHAHPASTQHREPTDLPNSVFTEATPCNGPAAVGRPPTRANFGHPIGRIGPIIQAGIGQLLGPIPATAAAATQVTMQV